MKARWIVALILSVMLTTAFVPATSAQPVPVWPNPEKWRGTVKWARTKYDGGNPRCWVAWFWSTTRWEQSMKTAVVFYEEAADTMVPGKAVVGLTWYWKDVVRLKRWTQVIEYFRPSPAGWVFIEAVQTLVETPNGKIVAAKYPLFVLEKVNGKLFLEFALQCGASENAIRDPNLGTRGSLMPYWETNERDQLLELWFNKHGYLVDVPAPSPSKPTQPVPASPAPPAGPPERP